MERYDTILAEINISTSELKTKSIQDLLKLSKENYNKNTEFWNQVSDILWSHLQTGLKVFDDQLLCATCFFTMIPLTDKQDIYLTELLQMIDKELFIKKDSEKKSDKTYNVVSMMYGMIQSSFLSQHIHKDVTKITAVLKPMFELLLLMGYEYSQFTFISFKTINLFRKIRTVESARTRGTDFQGFIFSKENQIKLLNFVNHNWENPVTGIRDLNRCIFQTLISVVDDEMYETIIKEINGFYWNKAKYLMLSEIIDLKKGNVCSLVIENKWVDGLIYSLFKPGLVSAGADMYFAIINQINFESDWCKLFQCQVMKVLNGTNSKAIENFKNFWCIMAMKKFPTLPYTLLEELKIHKSEHNLFSQLCIMNRANGFGILRKKFISPEDFGYIEQTIMNGIEHRNYNIRMLAFDIVSVTHRKATPSQFEYDLILNFLYNNVNSDCTVLRLSMLNSMELYLTGLHSIFMIVKNKVEHTEDLRDLLTFCTRLQSFVLMSLNLNGNYQRKITSVKLCNIILLSFSTIPYKRRGQTNHDASISLLDYLKEQGCWLLSTEDFVVKLVSLLKDPADDVRENVINLLLNYYSEELRRPNIIEHLVNGALKSMKSKFFYEISCGQSMFKLLSNLVINYENSIAEYKRVEDIFYFAYNELISEHIAKTTIMKSIETGKQLHSIMNILLVVLETCVAKSYKIDIDKIMPDFVEVLEGISNQFASEEESSTSSDFSKMSDMVENMIDNSGLSIGDEADETKISGLHQIVLNSLWLNVKASCNLASILVQLNKDDAGLCEKCLNIITHVLETSRHKGAIEAAGASLGKGIKFLTSLPEENKASEVPNTLLRSKLNDLISETNKMASITRRGAGLSIMVHRIVSNDMKKGKPLFHYFMNTLLQICDTTKDTPMKTDENQIDLPKAIYIHFLTRIVTDSSLASDMTFYFAKLAELAFGNLTSHHWQIRNAALQLYGALIPKQIGEKKASGSDEQTTATVACDELRTHSPKLWKYIMEQLEDNYEPDIVQVHSNLVPILNLLANSAKRYNFSYDMIEQKNVTEELFDRLVLLLDSPIHTVRRLTAKCIYNIHDFQQISDNLWFLLYHVSLSENFLHGSLILLNLCHKYYHSHQAYNMHFEKFRELFETKFFKSNEQHSYLCRKQFEDIYMNNYKFEDIERTILEMNNNVSFPGVDLWAESRLRKYIINTSAWSEVPALLNIILKQSNYEKYCEFIFLKIKTQDCKAEEILLKVVEALLTFEKKYSSSIIWRILFEISLKINLSGHLDTTELLKILQERESVYVIRYSIPLLARNITNIQNDDKLNLMKIISKYCDFENSDVDMRSIATLANNEITNEFDNLPDPVKVMSMKSAIMLLQDEDEDVRNLSVIFYLRLSKQEVVVHPYVCLNNMLSRNFLCNTINGSQDFMNELAKELSEILQANRSPDEYNPFANESKNIYFEPDVLKQLIENLDTV